MNEHLNTSDPVSISFISTYSHKHGGVVSESLGPEALAGDLIGEFGSEVNVQHDDLQLDSLDKISDKLKKQKVSIIGLSVKIGAVDQLNDSMKMIDQLPYKPLIILGGVVPTFASEQLLQKYPSSLIAVGESEMTMRGLVEHIRGKRELSGVPGLAYLEDGAFKSSPSERIDLSKLHLPARITTERVHDELKGLVWFEGSRGCDWHCTFCSRRALRGDGFSGDISPQHVVDDLENLSKMGITSVHATDDDWGGDPERTLAISEEIINRQIDIKWSISTRADHIWKEAGLLDDPREIEALNVRLRYITERQVQAGLDRVFIGLESFSKKQLKRYGKQISVAANYKAIEVLREVGVDVVAGYIPIDPLMSLEELQENLVGLRSTGMYKKVTNPLSVLRVQEGSPYLKMVRNREAKDGVKYLATRTEDLVFYDVINYTDPRIQVIADLADEWVTEMYPLIFGLKMEVFATTQSSRLDNLQAKTCEKALFTFRELEMRFIEDITGHFLKGGKNDKEMHEIVSDFKHARKRMIKESHDKLTEVGVVFTDSALNKLFTNGE